MSLIFSKLVIQQKNKIMHKFETKVNGIMKICKRVLSADLDKRGNITRGRGPKLHWSDVSL